MSHPRFLVLLCCGEAASTERHIANAPVQVAFERTCLCSGLKLCLRLSWCYGLSRKRQIACRHLASWSAATKQTRAFLTRVKAITMRVKRRRVAETLLELEWQLLEARRRQC